MYIRMNHVKCCVWKSKLVELGQRAQTGDRRGQAVLAGDSSRGAPLAWLGCVDLQCLPCRLLHVASLSAICGACGRTASSENADGRCVREELGLLRTREVAEMLVGERGPCIRRVTGLWVCPAGLTAASASVRPSLQPCTRGACLLGAGEAACDPRSGRDVGSDTQEDFSSGLGAWWHSGTAAAVTSD